MDLFGPTRTLSMGGKKYGFVIVNDYSRYHGYTSLHINMSLSRSLKYSIKEFQMKKDFTFILLEVTMKLSLRMLSLNHFLKVMVFSTTFLQRE